MKKQIPSVLAIFREQKGKVPILALSDGKVRSIYYWTPSSVAVEGFLK